MLSVNERISAFANLGIHLHSFVSQHFPLKENQVSSFSGFENVIRQSLNANKWFTEESILQSLKGIIKLLEKDKLENWISDYPLQDVNQTKVVAVIMAGNIPLVGFHDFLCVLLSGHSFLGKLSSDDALLLPAIAEMLVFLQPEFKPLFCFTSNKITDFEAVIATGSNNSARYFEYYFGKYPHIIRKNRNSIAILNGAESDEDMKALADDIFMYYGLGCRNVSKLYLPESFDLKLLLVHFEGYEQVKNHSRYFNNYEYNKAIYLINSIPHLDNGFLLVKEDPSLASPVSVLHFERYSGADSLQEQLQRQADDIQCIVSKEGQWHNSFPFGAAQYPEVSDYADGIDTLLFLTQL
ncbi:MAG: NAD-dependent aldehyde dehydrogenase [Bacteroidetes bacterium]|nr:MAG: NAD-dependent aldehyde dehydrogenase [Bacteroidota bacterium]